ncbi:hypothetical protein OSCI_1880003 [Kamptonema sp. PCC 6506]|nr:hypothetical protein OSCI_1880003 [Kamptonema sp. PCC 6506]
MESADIAQMLKSLQSNLCIVFLPVDETEINPKNRTKPQSINVKAGMGKGSGISLDLGRGAFLVGVVVVAPVDWVDGLIVE